MTFRDHERGAPSRELDGASDDADVPETPVLQTMTVRPLLRSPCVAVDHGRARRGFLEIGEPHAKEFRAGIPVVLGRRGIDFQKVQRRDVVDPRGQWVVREEKMKGTVRLLGALHDTDP